VFTLPQTPLTTGDVATMRFFFAEGGVKTQYRDISTITDHWMGSEKIWKSD
jgi:hypothetical protein